MREPVSCVDFESADDVDDVPASPRYSPSSSLGTCSSKPDVSVKKRDSSNTTLTVKRLFDNSNSLNISVKKQKMSPYYDHGEDEYEGEDVHDESADKSFSSLKNEVNLVEKLFKNCKRKRTEEEKKLQSIKRDIEECCKELRNKKQRVICVRRVNEIYNKMLGKAESKEEELKALTQKVESKKEELKALNQKVAEGNLELKSKEKELDAMKISISGQAEILESERKQLLKVISVMQNDRAQMRDVDSKKKRLENHVKELESKENECKGRVGELESKEKYLEGQLKALESRAKQMKGHVKRFESMKREFGDHIKKVESKNKQVEGQEMELKSKETQLEGLKKELELKEEKLEGRVKEHELKAEELEGRVKEIESKNKHLESQVEYFKSNDKQFEERWKELESKENQFKVKEKELKLKEKQIEVQVKELESKLNEFGGQLKEPELTGKHSEAFKKHIDEEKESVASYMDDQLSHTIGRTSLQLYTSEKTDDVESLCKDIFVYLQESADPSRLVLDIIQNPGTPLCKKGDNAVIIDECHIYLLEELMRISPTIKPRVREKALKLARDLKAYMRENTKNSSAVVGFMLLLSVYGLLTYFDKCEVLELFASVAQHKTVMELFETLGFANKASDFVKYLIRRKQFVEAVRFSCAYNLADKNQLIDMLREHVQNVKLICTSRCEKTNSIEIKDKARDQEIASLGTVLQCISDNSLESEDLLREEIQCRIHELNQHKGK
ncbi:myosin-10 isoform X2 [Medicago truncatula]|nr:myosin-10 isoform X2 [Medicago truncatula]